MLDQQEGETVAARRLIEESVELFRKSGDRWRLQTALDRLPNPLRLLRASG